MRVTTALLVVLLLLGLLSLPSLRTASANPNVLLVPNQYSHIRDALAAASAGDTIMVSSGTYYETNLVITQNGLTLQGQDKTNTIIDGQNSTNKIIIIQANNIVVRSFTIRNAGTLYSGGGSFGVFLNYSSNTLLKDNIFSGDSYSVRAQNSNNVTVSSSSFLGDAPPNKIYGAGVYVDSCQTGLMINNTFNGDHVGIYLIFGSTGFTIRNNTFSSSIFLGVNAANSPRNWVVQNMFRDNNMSLELKQSNGINNIVVGNWFMRSQTAGLVIEAAQNNTIHHNNFINNTQQVEFIDSPLPNVWSMSGFIAEGNYWSDYHGADTDRNGIGDTPYNIGTGNQDAFPLIGPFTEHQVTSYNVYTVSSSTITSFNINSVSKQISFQAAGTSGSLGVCRVVFPTTMLSPPYTVYVNGVTQSANVVYNESYTALYFSYTQSSTPSNVIIVPEFPLSVMIALLLILTLAIATLKKRKLRDVNNFV